MKSNVKIPELREWSDADFSAWWRNHAGNPFSFFVGRCPHCGSHNARMIVKSRNMIDGYDSRSYECIESCQVECNMCHARGGLYRRELIDTPERPKYISHDSWSSIQKGIGYWNIRS